MEVEVKHIARSKSVVAEAKVNAAKSVTVRANRDGSVDLSLPDWGYVGSYHRTLKGLKPDDAHALRACLNALYDEEAPAR